MINITIKQIRYFEALARLKHFGHASAACAISQPALSMQIRELEETVGAPLVERAARNVRLTPFGEDFLARAVEILQSMERLEAFTRAASTGRPQRLRLGVIPTIGPYLLPSIIAALTKEFAGIDLQIRETVTSRLIVDVAEGRLDAAIVALPVSEPTFHEEPLFDESFVLVRAATEAGAPIPNLEDLREMKLLLLEEGHCFRDQALSLCRINPALRQGFLDASSLSTLVQMVGAGVGVTLIPEMAAPVETRSANVEVVRLPPPEPGRSIGMIWRKKSAVTDQMLAIHRVVREAAPARVERPRTTSGKRRQR